MAIVKVNRSGKCHKIYLTNTLKADEQIGTLYNNEVFTWIAPWNGNGWGYSAQSIMFRASDGTAKVGWISAAETDKVLERKLAVDGYVTRLDLGEMKELLRLLRPISNNVNPMARRSNETGSLYGEDVENLRKGYVAVKGEVVELVGRMAKL